MFLKAQYLVNNIITSPLERVGWGGGNVQTEWTSHQLELIIHYGILITDISLLYGLC